jgi:Concanavalin A-like lectin/glucanases superfamily
MHLNLALAYKFFMKKIVTILFLLSAFISNAQQSFFKGNNNYVAPSTSFQAPTIVTTDLLLNLDADNPSSYPGTGNTWYDLSANLNNGTIATAAMANTTSTPKKFTFNGTTGNNVSFVSSKFNVPYTGKTVMVAAKMDANFGTNQFRALFGNTGTRNFNLYIYNNGSSYQIHFSAGSWGLSDVVPLVTGQWYVFAATQDANNIRYYVNGVLVGTTTSAPLYQYQSSTNEFLGNADNYWYGDINTALIYNRGLSTDEIVQNYNALKSRFGL